MATPPTRDEIAGTPTNAEAKAGFGKLWDYVTGLLGATGDAAQARALIVPSIVDNGNATAITIDSTKTVLGVNGTERARIDSSGNLLVGVDTMWASTSGFLVANTLVTTYANSVGLDGANSAASCLKLGNMTGGRSLNASGTLNASGADYAEYMIKAGDFTVAKGDVVGINADGKLTNVFADAVSFCVKSTDPSYVGGDVWGNEEALGLTKPQDDATEEEKATFEAALEAARQTVDRIAFAGQVPVNVTGANAGQFIVPTNDNGSIIGVAVNEADMTLSQYMKAVGKVIAIEQDGRAKIIVKVA